MSRARLYWIAAIAAIVGIAADQASKWALLEIVGLRENPRNIRVLPIFDIVMWPNYGTSFSLFRTGEAWGPYAFSIAALAIIVLLVLWLSRIVSPILAAAIGAVIGGALGNLIDRLVYGRVADFFHLYAYGYDFYVFNVADAAITFGVLGLLYDALVKPESPKGAGSIGKE